MPTDPDLLSAIAGRKIFSSLGFGDDVGSVGIVNCRHELRATPHKLALFDALLLRFAKPHEILLLILPFDPSQTRGGSHAPQTHGLIERVVLRNGSNKSF
jgi:hypothetical protein